MLKPRRCAGPFSRPALCSLLDPIKLVRPETLEPIYPIMHAFQLPGFKLVNPVPAVPSRGDNANFVKHREVLGDSRLPEPERCNQRPNSQRPASAEQFDDLPAPRLGDCVEHVRCRSCTRHTLLYSHTGIYQACRAFHFMVPIEGRSVGELEPCSFSRWNENTDPEGDCATR
jgi:hypothetical protein